MKAFCRAFFEIAGNYLYDETLDILYVGSLSYVN